MRPKFYATGHCYRRHSFVVYDIRISLIIVQEGRSREIKKRNLIIESRGEEGVCGHRQRERDDQRNDSTKR